MKKLTITLMMAAFLLAGCGSPQGGSPNTGPGQYDEFAQCLTEEGAKMYGAYWCPHCARQKDMFGNSFQHVTYIECSLPNRAGTTRICQMADIQSYPTWEFSDGSRATGVIQLEQLANKTGCEL